VTLHVATLRNKSQRPIELAAANWPVNIIWESFEISVDDFGQKVNQSRSVRDRGASFLCSHNSPQVNIPRIRHAASWLDNFPLIHRHHHNNKVTSFMEMSFEEFSVWIL